MRKFFSTSYGTGKKFIVILRLFHPRPLRGWFGSGFRSKTLEGFEGIIFEIRGGLFGGLSFVHEKTILKRTRVKTTATLLSPLMVRVSVSNAVD